MANPENLTAPKFQPGQSGNPGGISKELKAKIMRNAEMAVALRERMLSKMAEKLESVDWTPELEANLLKLLNDAENRGLGAPKQVMEGGEVPITTIKRVIIDGPESGNGTDAG